MYEFISIFLAPYICSTMYLENTASVVFNYWTSNLNNYKYLTLIYLSCYIDDLGNKLIKLRKQVEDDKIPGNMECDRFLSLTVY